MNEIYMDNACTSFPKAEGVSDAMKYYLDRVCANAGRGVGDFETLTIKYKNLQKPLICYIISI